ncbi:MAG: hypothetical protein GX442_00165 [Candidatus Riflebacteria bacterium]|nr:hypothetical protein [Candidatus Riflebacteria bacterium]
MRARGFVGGRRAAAVPTGLTVAAGLCCLALCLPLTATAGNQAAPQPTLTASNRRSPAMAPTDGAPTPPATTPTSNPAAGNRVDPAVAAAPTVGPHLAPDPALDAQFRAMPGFLGGDGCFTVPLPGHRTLLLFGDTFVASGSSPDRRQAAFVHNTAALAEGEVEAGTRIRFLAGRLPFLPSPATDTWLWPLDGICRDGRLSLFATEIRQVADDPFGFREVGNHLFVIDNPADPVGEWRFTRHRIPWGRFGRKASLTWGGSLVAHDGQTLIYGVHQREDGRKSLVLARAPGRLEDFRSWSFFRRTAPWRCAKPALPAAIRGGKGVCPTSCRSDGWQPAPHAPSPLVSPIANEFTVYAGPAPDGGPDRFFLVASGEGGLSWDIIRHEAGGPDFARPVTRVLHRFPAAAFPQGVFCYSAKAVRRGDGRPPDRVVHFTNATTADPLLLDNTWYWPEFHRLPGHGE